MKGKRCVICKESRPLAEFNRRVRSRDGLQPHCRECNRKHSAAYYARNREQHIQDVKPYRRRYQRRNREHLLAHLREHPCVDCGERDLVVLELDHVRGAKVKGVGVLAADSAHLDDIRAEMAKCEVRCVNCHRRRTHRTRRTWRTRLGASGLEPEASGLKIRCSTD